MRARNLLRHYLNPDRERLIDERDVYLGEKIRRIDAARVVAVVGAGHVPGMVRAMKEEHDLAELESLPEPGAWSKIWPWLVPAAVVALIAWGFWHGGVQRGIDSVLIWTGVNAALAGLGALLAMGLAFSLVMQAMVNMGVAVGLFPVTGQPLPFVSMGGTSLLFTGMSIGIIISVTKEIDKVKNDESDSEIEVAETDS